MSHQENPNIRFINLRCTQELYRKAELEAAARKMKDVSAFVRHLVTEATMDTELTKADYALIEKRITERREAKKKKEAKHG